MQTNTAIDGPSKHCKRNHLRTVVHYDGFRVTSQFSDRVEHAGHAFTGERKVRFERKVFARAIVAYSEDAKSAVVSQPIVDEIERPSLVRHTRRIARRPAPQRQLPPNALANLEIRCSVNAADAFMVVADSLATQQHGKPRKTVPPVLHR